MTKYLIVIGLVYFIVWPWMRRRWPDFQRRLNWALVAALIAVILFRALAEVRRRSQRDEEPIHD